MDGRAGVRQRFTALEPVLDEKSRRLLVAAESNAWGLGGISVVCKATGVSRQVIRQGLRELEEAPTHHSPLRRLQLLFRVVDEDFPARSALLAPRGNEEFPQSG